MMGGLQLLSYLGLERLAGGRWGLSYGIGILAGAAVAGTTVAFITQELSRGFGAALSGSRFDPLLTSLYLAWGGAAGAILVAAASRCERKRRLPR